jgi:hypothetical protein
MNAPVASILSGSFLTKFIVSNIRSLVSSGIPIILFAQDAYLCSAAISNALI